MAPLLRRIRIKLYLLTHPFLWNKHLSLEGLFEIDCPPGLKLGHYVSIGHNCFLQCNGGITIGDYVCISRGVSLITGQLQTDNYLRDAVGKNRTHVTKPIVIGSGTWIGLNSIVLGGVTIAPDCIIAAGSVVTKSCLTPGCLYGGVPAKLLKKMN